MRGATIDVAPRMSDRAVHRLVVSDGLIDRDRRLLVPSSCKATHRSYAGTVVVTPRHQRGEPLLQTTSYGSFIVPPVPLIGSICQRKSWNIGRSSSRALQARHTGTVRSGAHRALRSRSWRSLRLPGSYQLVGYSGRSLPKQIARRSEPASANAHAIAAPGGR